MWKLKEIYKSDDLTAFHRMLSCVHITNVDRQLTDLWVARVLNFDVKKIENKQETGIFKICSVNKLYEAHQTDCLQSYTMWASHILIFWRFPLLSLFYCTRLPGNHAKLCTRNIVHFLCFIQETIYNSSMGRICYIICFGPRCQLGSGM